MSNDLSKTVVAIQLKRSEVPPSRGILIGITGIDGCGKSHLTGRIVSELQKRSLKAVGIQVDGWLNLPDNRFNPASPAEHFYEDAIRFKEMFDQLVLPLRQKRQHRVVADFVEENPVATFH